MSRRPPVTRSLVRTIPLVPRRLLLGLAFLAAILVAGIIGFTLEEHESVLDAILTTVSAISTVGYSPPHPLSAAGKILAIALIIAGLFGSALVISALTEYFMEGHLAGAWELRRMERAIAALTNHYIVSGYGRVGHEVTHQLTLAGAAFVIVDINEDVLEDARESGHLFVHGDASNDEVLHRVNVGHARGLIACADSDMNNVYVTLSAREACPNLFIVARAAHADAERKLYKAGANRVVSPYVMAARQMATLATRAELIEERDILFEGTQIEVRVHEVQIDRTSVLVGKTVKEAHRTVLAGAFVMAVERHHQLIQEVDADLTLRPGDRLLVVGTGAQLRRLTTIE